MYGTVLLVCGPLGSFAAGWLSDHVDRRGPQGGPFKVGLVFALLTLAPAVVSPLVADPYVSLGLIAILVFFLSGPIALAISALQQITPNEMRGQVSAVYLLILNFLGIGFGPTLVALITDYGFGDDMALRYSMAIVGAGASVSSILLLAIGTKPFRDSLKRAEEWAEPEQEELTGNEVPAY
jgi:MFS family permease